MPSFDAPIRTEYGPSRWLTLWRSTCAGATVLAALGILSLHAGPWAWLAAALALFSGSVGASRLAFPSQSGGGSQLELHADGTLYVRREAGAPEVLQAGEVALVKRGPFLTLSGRRLARVTGDRRRTVHLYLAADAVPQDQWRRLCAWSRAGLPRSPNDAPRRRL
ncbi:MAG: hypothetical protein AAGA68_12195 [Pseudomonadota bacterium]